MNERQRRDLRQRAIRDARHLHEERHSKVGAAVDLEPLRWAPDHLVLVDDRSCYHRISCAHVDDQARSSGRWYESWQPLPRDEDLRACPDCEPELILINEPGPAWRLPNL